LVTTTPTTGFYFDLLSWEYPTPNKLRGDLGADAFVIWWENDDTDDPQYCAAVLPVSARQWGQLVPTPWRRSYAITAVRFCHAGPEESAKQQVTAWRNLT
jgi:hypothetical protein